MQTQSLAQIDIVGGGFGGLSAAKELAGKEQKRKSLSQEKEKRDECSIEINVQPASYKEPLLCKLH